MPATQELGLALGQEGRPGDDENDNKKKDGDDDNKNDDKKDGDDEEECSGSCSDKKGDKKKDGDDEKGNKKKDGDDEKGNKKDDKKDDDDEEECTCTCGAIEPPEIIELDMGGAPTRPCACVKCGWGGEGCNTMVVLPLRLCGSCGSGPRFEFPIASGSSSPPPRTPEFEYPNTPADEPEAGDEWPIFGQM